MSNEQAKPPKTHRASHSFADKPENNEITITNTDQEEIKKELDKHTIIESARVTPVIVATTEKNETSEMITPSISNDVITNENSQSNLQEKNNTEEESK